MSFALSRVVAGFAALLLPVCAIAAPDTPTKPAEVPWLFKGSDIPVDPAWTFGVLPNGVRYAVRHNEVPQHQVAVRVIIDAGSFMEGPSELGYAHFMEHLSFRGSKYDPQGQALKIWQRLGTTFGSDTNANTGNTQTVYKLDLPNATRDGLEESMKLLSSMMEAPLLTDAAVQSERRTVENEARESGGADERLGEATRNLFFAHQLLSTRPPIGTTATLEAATSKSLRAWHDRWYRPDRAVVVIVGDGDPALFEQLIARNFGDWRGKGPSPAEPDFGKPTPQARNVEIVQEPGLPTTLTLSWARPWLPHNDTIVYNQAKLIDIVALKILNRRLEARARRGESFLVASTDQQDISRSVDDTLVQMTPLTGDWRKGLADLRGMIAEAMTVPPTPAEIDRETKDFVAELDAQVEQARADTGSKLADSIAEAVAIRETVASPQVARDVFGALQGKITPQDIVTATKRLFGGVGPRLLMSSTSAMPGGTAQLEAALEAPAKLLSSKVANAVTFDQLPALGPPGKVVSTTSAAHNTMKIITLDNGVRVLLFSLDGASGRVYVSARFGRGRLGMPVDHPTTAFAGPGALVSSGIGKLGINELDSLMNGRLIGMSLQIDDDAFALRSQTDAANLADELKLLATKLAFPRWDAAPVERVRAAMLTEQAGVDASAVGVLEDANGGLLTSGDPRFSSATRAQIAALTPSSFKAFWAPQLASGPIELLIIGDFKEDAAIKAALDSFGALPRRDDQPIAAASAHLAGPTPSATRRIVYHRGDKDQAVALLAWPTGHVGASASEENKLEVLTAIFNQRLFDRLREAAGEAYSPHVGNNWRNTFPEGSSIEVVSQLKPDGVKKFFEIARDIANDLAARPVSPDEFNRAVGPMQALVMRAFGSELYWLNQLGGATRDPQRMEDVLNLPVQLKTMTPADIQAVARTYLTPDHALEYVVLPRASASK